VTNVQLQDVAAAIVSVLVIASEALLSVLRIPIPAELSAAQGSVLTWLFIRAAQQAERDAADTRFERSQPK